MLFFLNYLVHKHPHLSPLVEGREDICLRCKRLHLTKAQATNVGKLLICRMAQLLQDALCGQMRDPDTTQCGIEYDAERAVALCHKQLPLA